MADDPFEDRRKKNDEEGLQDDMEVERNLRFLINSEAGCWLLRKLIKESHQFGAITRYGNNKDYPEHGKYDLIEKIVMRPIIDHFGYGAFDKILKGNK